MRRAALLLAAALSACAPARPGGPPTVRLGVDPCARCGMIVSEERFAGGYIDDEGRSVVFDDPGELLAALEAQPALRARSFVQDAGGAGWVPAAAAVFKKIPGLPTPMGSGVAAFKDAAEAAALEARLAPAAR